MSDQKISNERKKELEQLDPFQEKLLQIMAYVKEYKKQLLMISCAIVAIIMIFSGVMYSFKKAEMNASILVAQTLNEYAKFDDPVKGYLEVEDDFKVIFDKYANTVAGKMARFRFAKICYDASELDRAFDLYKTSLDEFKSDESMKNLILASLGYVSQARQKLDMATAYFLEIEKGQSMLLKDEARFALAILYEKAGDMSTSQKFYQKVVDAHEQSIYKPLAESKLASIN